MQAVQKGPPGCSSGPLPGAAPTSLLRDRTVAGPACNAPSDQPRGQGGYETFPLLVPVLGAQGPEITNQLMYTEQGKET